LTASRLHAWLPAILLATTPLTGQPAEPRMAVVREVEAALTRPGTPASQVEWAGRTLGGLDPESALAIARPVVTGSASWAARREVARALALIRHPERGHLLEILSRDASWAVRHAAIRTLGLLARPEGLASVLAAQDDTVWSVRWQAMRALAAYAPGDCPPEQRQQRLAILLDAASDPDREVREEAERVLLVHPEPGALAVYLRILDRIDESRPLVRRRALAAARALKRLAGVAPVRTALEGRLEHANLRARILAARVLQLRGEDLTPRLEGRLATDIVEGWSRESGPLRAAAEGLAHTLGPKAVRAILPHLVGGAGVGALEEIAEWVVDALGGPRNKQPDGVDSLVRLLKSPQIPPPFRDALTRSLRRLGTRAPRSFLESTYLEGLEAAIRAHPRDAGDPHAAHRLDLFLALAETAPYSGWAEVVARALGDPSVHVRRLAALNWIMTAGVANPFERLTRILKEHGSEHLGRDFLRRIARERGDATFDFLMAMAQGTLTNKAVLRVGAINALTSTTWSPHKERKLLAWLRRRLKLEADPTARIRILMLLGNLDPRGALELMAGVALDAEERPDVRVRAINKLGQSGLLGAAAPLREIVDRPDAAPGTSGPGETARIKAAALRGLFALARPEDRDVMINVVQVGPERTRRLALSALEKLRDPAARPAVEAMVKNGLVEGENRVRGFRVLAAIGGPDIADYLLKRLREENQPELRVGALEALSLLKPEDYSDRLLHYLGVLKAGRHNDATSRERFTELIGELGKAPALAVTRFLVDFLLEGHLRPDARPLKDDRLPPLEQAAAAALLGQGPDRVRVIFNARIEARRRDGTGLGVREAFYFALIREFVRPSRQAEWGDLAVDLSRCVWTALPAGSKHDFHCLKFAAERAFETGRFEEAAEAYARIHRLAQIEGYLDREGTETALADDPIARPLALSRISAALALPPERAEESVACIREGVDLARHDGPTLLTAVHALGRLGRGFDLARVCLDRLGPRARGSRTAAVARFELGLGLLAAGRKTEAISELKAALADHPALREAARNEPNLERLLTREERTTLLEPPER